MRSIVSLSIDQKVLIWLKKYAKKRGFASLSKYFVYATELEQQMISEDELHIHIKEARESYKTWKTIQWIDLLTSIANKKWK